MTLEETIFTILLKNKLDHFQGNVFDVLFERKDDEYVFKDKDMITMAIDIANEFKNADRDNLLTEG